MRRRGGTNRLRGPKKEKPALRKLAGVEPEISGDLYGSGASSANENVPVESCPATEEIPGPSSACANPNDDSDSDFVFKRPKTPPPKTPKKTPFIPFSTGGIERCRIRSKLKPGKTGFPIGASLHGLSRSEKLERRSREKSRVHSGAPLESNLEYPTYTAPEINIDSRQGQNIPVHEGFRGAWKPTGAEQVISYPKQTVTKLKFPSAGQRSSPTTSEKRGKRCEDMLTKQGVKESIEICQGFSKIKIEDWYPLFDFHHSKQNPPNVETSSNTESANADTSENADDDEWEESLVYVNLEDIPDVDSLFSTFASRRQSEDDEDTEREPVSQFEMKIFNLDSNLPVLRIGGRYLAGSWEDTCGTSLFFKKKNWDDDAEATSTEKPKLKNLVPEPEIPYDPVFGRNFANQDEGYELVAKSMKVLKARYFPVVNEELKGEDIVRDADDEFDHKDFLIPPVSMVREFLPGDMAYEQYLEKDIERRRKIREKWGKSTKAKVVGDASRIVKTEPLDPDDDEFGSDTDDSDIFILNSDKNSEPSPGTSGVVSK